MVVRKYLLKIFSDSLQINREEVYLGFDLTLVQNKDQLSKMVYFTNQKLKICPLSFHFSLWYAL